MSALLATVASWLCECVLYCADPEKFYSLAQYFNFAHLLLEDGMQVVLYSIVASGNASSGTEDNIVQVGLVLAAGIQSLLFFFQRGHELWRETRAVQVDVRVTHGATAAPAPRLGSLGSPCTCTMVHLGSSAPNCTVHLGASELMRTRIKVLIRPLAPNRTVHLGASERLTVCVAQPGNGYTSARIAAETFRLQLSYTKIKSG